MGSIDTLTQIDAVGRLRGRDASLFSDDLDVQALVADRLGWTHLASTAAPTVQRAAELAHELREAGVTDLLLLGMGGSSLAALVMSEVLSSKASGVTLHVLDTTNPTTVSRTLAALDPSKTAAFVASKSGTTIEPLVLYDAVTQWLRDHAAEQPGQHFVAITDPDSDLERLAAEARFRAIVHTPPDVGGRYSALTAFGLVPAAAAGVDLAELVGRALDMEQRSEQDPVESPPVALAAFIFDARQRGADKLTLVMSPALRPLGLWIEQLVAESTGKQGLGVLPVVELSDESPSGYGEDRAVVVIRLANDVVLAEWAESIRGQLPLLEIELGDRYDLGAEFVRWEYAVALVGVLLGINPFDEPNVAQAKKATSDVLAGAVKPRVADAMVESVGVGYHGALDEPPGAAASLADALSVAVGSLGPRGYLAILAYLPLDHELIEPVSTTVPMIAAATGRAVTLEIGPRYLHSTGQLHKGGPPTGTFVVITTRDKTDIPLEGRGFSLAELHRAQAQGDVITLASHGRPVLHVDLPDSSPESIARLADALSDDAVLAG